MAGDTYRLRLLSHSGAALPPPRSRPMTYAVLVPGHSDGVVPDSHRIPYSSGRPKRPDTSDRASSIRNRKSESRPARAPSLRRAPDIEGGECV